MKIQTSFNFGDQVEHALTGLKGSVVAVDVWKNGCVRMCVQPREIKDGKPVDATWCDEQDLARVKAEGDKEQPAPSGGPQADCPAPGRQ